MPSVKSALITRLFHLVQLDDPHSLSELFSTPDKPTLKTLEDDVINELDYITQESALHLSASKLSYESMKLLLEHGADPNLKNGGGQTPSLLIVRRLKECCCESCTRNAVRCINILGDHHADFSVQNKVGESPLYLAAQYQLLECATTLLRNGAPIEETKRRGHHRFLGKHKSMLTLMSEKLPSIVLNVFDRAVSIQGSKSIHDPDCEVVFDLSVILPTKVMESYQSQQLQQHSSDTQDVLNDQNGHDFGNKIHPLQNGQNNKSNAQEEDVNNSIHTENYRPKKEMGFLNDLLESRNTDSKIYRAILRHPLVGVFTDVKWSSLELVFIAFILMQVGVLLAYTAFLFITIFVDCPFEVYQHIRTNIENIDTKTANVKIGSRLPTAEQLCEMQLGSKLISGYVVTCVTAVLIKELQHAVMDFKEYVTDLLNYVQLLGLGSIMLTMVIAWDPYSKLYTWLYPVAAFGIGISWCQLFVQIGRFPQCGIYIDMFAKIALNFCWSLSIYSFILIGFAMSYCVLFPVKPEFIDIPLAMIRVITMMAGELDYQGLFMNDDVPSTSSKDNKTKDDNSSNRNFAVAYPVSAHLWYIGFVITITFVLMNLLVGLAVSDIQGCRKDAEIVVMKRRIRYTCYLEKSYYLLTQFFPRFLKDFLRKKITLIKPSNERTFSCLSLSKLRIDNYRLIIRPNDSTDKILSEESKNSIKHWLSHQHTPRTRQVCKFNSKFKKQLHNLESNIEETGDIIQQNTTERASSSTSTSSSIKRMEKRLAELDHKLDMLLEQARSKSPD